MGTQIGTTAEVVSTSEQTKPLAHAGLPRLQLSQQVALAPPSNETQVAARPRESAGQLPVPVQIAVQMRSPEPTTWQVKAAGQSLLVKQKS